MADSNIKTMDAVAAAHQRLLHQPGLQFDFSAAPPPAQTPEWLVNLIKFLGHLRPVFEVLFWGGIAILAALILYFIGREMWRYYRRYRAKQRGTTALPTPDWRPPPARARALLAEADRLATAGRYADAVHVLLFRSIEDIDERRPRAVKPALTSRDIASLDGLPAQARRAFARIAASVEKSFFAGREIDAADFAECRRAYEAFAVQDSWPDAWHTQARRA